MFQPEGALRTILLCRCPRCGRGPLFRGYLAIAPTCSACGLDFAPFDVGDGAPALVILVVGTVICAGALWLEFSFRPPFWLHAAIWPTLTGVASYFSLRIVKSALAVQQYRHRAGEGKVAR